MKTMKLSVRFVSMLLAVLATMTFVNRAAAHSFPEEQHPSAGETVATAPSQVVIKFDAPIEKLFAKVEVLDAAGKNDAVGAPTIDPDGRILTIKVATLQPGQYRVKWSVVCIDSHHTEGSYQFTVASGS